MENTAVALFADPQGVEVVSNPLEFVQLDEIKNFEAVRSTCSLGRREHGLGNEVVPTALTAALVV